MYGMDPIPEIDVLWIPAGLSCDGDSVSMTAASIASKSGGLIARGGAGNLWFLSERIEL